jgi:hypothetical protein
VKTTNLPLQVLLDVLEQSHSRAVLGAGVSAPMVPLMQELRPLAAQRLLATGIFPAETIARDAVVNGVLGPPRADIPAWDLTALVHEELLARHISPAAARAVTVALLVPRRYERVPPQYAVFNLSAWRLGLINYNNDGLARQHCGRHLIVDVHGTTLSAEELAQLRWDDWIRIHQEFPDLPAINIPGLHFPEPEPLAMLGSSAYAQVTSLLQSAQRLAIIGYSFGADDDWIGYRHILSTLAEGTIPAVIVKPDALELAQRMAGESRNAQVVGLPMYWDRLACAILASRRHQQRKTCMHRRLCARCIDYLYHSFLDSGLDWSELTRRFDLTCYVSTPAMNGSSVALVL